MDPVRGFTAIYRVGFKVHQFFISIYDLMQPVTMEISYIRQAFSRFAQYFILFIKRKFYYSIRMNIGYPKWILKWEFSERMEKNASHFKLFVK